MPCWNVAKWLRRSMADVFAALPPCAEVIAVDDGSTDGTGAILEDERAKRGPALRVVRAAHRGVSAARNAALAMCRGEFVFFVDPDDGVESDFFTAMIDAMRRDGADYCIAAYKTRADGSDGPMRDVPLKGDYRFAGADAIVEKYLPRIFGYSFDDVRAWYGGEALFARREMAAVWRAAFRRDVIERASVRFDETVELYEDMVFNAQYLLAAKKMTCVARPLYRVTERSSGAMSTVPRDGLRLARNKLRLLASRNRLDAASGGRLAPIYAGTCVFSALEILSLIARGRLPFGEGRRILREYLADAAVRRALKGFPLSWRRPLVAAGALFLRYCRCI